MDSYEKAYTEVLEVLNYIPEEEKNLVPSNLFEAFQKNADKNYIYHIDTNLSFDKQNLLNETKAILAVLFRDYWATDYQREQILLQEKRDRAEYEAKLREKYNSDNLFKDRNNNEKVARIKEDKNEIVSNQNNTLNELKSSQNNAINEFNHKQLVVVKEKQNWITKLFYKIKNFFNKK